MANYQNDSQKDSVKEKKERKIIKELNKSVESKIFELTGENIDSKIFESLSSKNLTKINENNVKIEIQDSEDEHSSTKSLIESKKNQNGDIIENIDVPDSYRYKFVKNPENLKITKFSVVFLVFMSYLLGKIGSKILNTLFISCIVFILTRITTLKGIFWEKKDLTKSVGKKIDDFLIMIKFIGRDTFKEHLIGENKNSLVENNTKQSKNIFNFDLNLVNRMTESFWEQLEPVVSLTVINFVNEILEKEFSFLKLKRFSIGNIPIKFSKILINNEANEVEIVAGIDLYNFKKFSSFNPKKFIYSNVLEVQIALGKGSYHFNFPVRVRDVAFSAEFMIRLDIKDFFKGINLLNHEKYDSIVENFLIKQNKITDNKKNIDLLEKKLLLSSNTVPASLSSYLSLIFKRNKIMTSAEVPIFFKLTKSPTVNFDVALLNTLNIMSVPKLTSIINYFISKSIKDLKEDGLRICLKKSSAEFYNDHLVEELGSNFECLGSEFCEYFVLNASNFNFTNFQRDEKILAIEFIVLEKKNNKNSDDLMIHEKNKNNLFNNFSTVLINNANLPYVDDLKTFYRLYEPCLSLNDVIFNLSILTKRFSEGIIIFHTNQKNKYFSTINRNDALKVSGDKNNIYDCNNVHCLNFSEKIKENSNEDSYKFFSLYDKIEEGFIGNCCFKVGDFDYKIDFGLPFEIQELKEDMTDVFNSLNLRKTLLSDLNLNNNSETTNSKSLISKVTFKNHPIDNFRLNIFRKNEPIHIQLKTSKSVGKFIITDSKVKSLENYEEITNISKKELKDIKNRDYFVNSLKKSIKLQSDTLFLGEKMSSFEFVSLNPKKEFVNILLGENNEKMLEICQYNNCYCNKKIDFNIEKYFNNNYDENNKILEIEHLYFPVYFLIYFKIRDEKLKIKIKNYDISIDFKLKEINFDKNKLILPTLNFFSKDKIKDKVISEVSKIDPFYREIKSVITLNLNSFTGIPNDDYYFVFSINGKQKSYFFNSVINQNITITLPMVEKYEENKKIKFSCILLRRNLIYAIADDIEWSWNKLSENDVFEKILRRKHSREIIGDLESNLDISSNLDVFKTKKRKSEIEIEIMNDAIDNTSVKEFDVSKILESSEILSEYSNNNKSNFNYFGKNDSGASNSTETTVNSLNYFGKNDSGVSNSTNSSRNSFNFSGKNDSISTNSTIESSANNYEIFNKKLSEETIKSEESTNSKNFNKSIDTLISSAIVYPSESSLIEGTSIRRKSIIFKTEKKSLIFDFDVNWNNLSEEIKTEGTNIKRLYSYNVFLRPINMSRTCYIKIFQETKKNKNIIKIEEISTKKKEISFYTNELVCKTGNCVFLNNLLSEVDERIRNEHVKYEIFNYKNSKKIILFSGVFPCESLEYLPTFCEKSNEHTEFNIKIPFIVYKFPIHNKKEISITRKKMLNLQLCSVFNLKTKHELNCKNCLKSSAKKQNFIFKDIDEKVKSFKNFISVLKTYFSLKVYKNEAIIFNSDRFNSRNSMFNNIIHTEIAIYDVIKIIIVQETADFKVCPSLGNENLIVDKNIEEEKIEDMIKLGSLVKFSSIDKESLRKEVLKNVYPGEKNEVIFQTQFTVTNTEMLEKEIKNKMEDLLGSLTETSIKFKVQIT